MDHRLGDWLHVIKHEKKRLLVVIFCLAVAITFYLLAGDYVTDNGKNVAVPDLILDHIGPYNLNFIFVWLFIAVIVVFVVYPIVFKPKEIPYYINMFSLFLVIRSGFVLFTHLKVPSDAIMTGFPSYLQLLNFSNDLFFSGHAGLSFLGFLILRRDSKPLAYFMLASSIVLGITVLLMHVHYSIDVFSAYFIAYGIYKIGNMFIKR